MWLKHDELERLDHVVGPVPAGAKDERIEALGQRPRGVVKTLVAILAGSVAALLLAHHPMIFSGLRQMQQDQGDTRLNNYLLEHIYQWIRSSPQHPAFWDPPEFSPRTNILAYSDVMLSFAPVYWFWRAAGFEPDTAFQFWMLTTCVINFLMAFVFLRTCFGVSRRAALFGAVFFAGASSRVAQLTHQQLYCQTYVLLACIALVRMFVSQAKSGTAPDSSRRHGTELWIGTFGLCIVLQFWGGFYNGYFILLGCGIALFWAMLVPLYRRSIVEILWRNRIAVVLTAAGVFLLLLPLGIRYLAAMKSVGPRSLGAVGSFLPRPQSWIYLGPWNCLYGWMNRISIFANMPCPFEQGIGLGFGTTLVALMGLWMGRRRPLIVLAALTMATLIAVSTLVAGQYSLWHIAYWWLPGAGALRAVCRLGLLLTLPAAIGVALLIDRCRGKLWRIGLGAGLLCLSEQINVSPHYDKFEVRDRVNAIVARIPPHAGRFFYSVTYESGRPEAQIDAMWASMRSGIPTINGYTSSIPPDYELWDIVAITPAQRRALRVQLERWINRWGLDERDVAWISDVDGQPPARRVR
ncbi:MAG: hypothetical protein ABSB33_14395 [Tepidisphaeraceae bacterium]